MNYTTQSGQNVTELKALELITSAAAAMTLYTLKHLMSKADKTAIAALEGKNTPLMEDLKQEAALYILQGLQGGTIAFNDLLCVNTELLSDEELKAANRFIYADISTKLTIFRALRRYVYNTTSKHEKQTAVALDSEDAHDIASKDNILDELTAKAFADTLNALQRQVWEAMLLGYTQTEICDLCGLSNGKASRLILSVKQALKDYYIS